MRLRLMMRVLAGGVLATSAAGPVLAAPQWTEAPTFQDVAKAYPSRARAAHVGGSATVTCTVSPSARLRTCGVLDETPGGYGFGNAARKLAERLVATPSSAPEGKELRVTLRFRPEMAAGGGYIASDPVWITVPSAQDFHDTLSKARASLDHIRVVLLCDVAERGSLAGCQAESEAPAGQGLGAAALELAPKIRVGLLAADGTPLVGAKVRVPIRYDLMPGAPAP